LLSSVQNSKALGSLVFARIIYAVNWLNVGAIFYLMSKDVGAGVSGLGTVTASFYLGIGITQVPGGLLVARYGPKRIVLSGILLTSLSVLGTSVVSTVPELALLRFLAGAGMAFVFAPGVVLVAGLLRGGKSGMGVGLFNSAYDIGGLLAIFGWIVIATWTGWRPSLALSGGLGVLTGVFVFLFVPGDVRNTGFRVNRGVLFDLLKDRQLVLLGLGTLGFGIGSTIISGFMVYYLNEDLGVEGTLAGLVASLVTVVPIFTALWGGRVYDTVSRHRIVMVLALVGSAVALGLAASPSLYSAIACSALGGVVSGFGFTFAFAGAKDLNRAGVEYDSLAIAWVNSISLTGSFLPPVFFSYVTSQLGYSQAWLWSAVLTLAFLFPVLLMVERWGR
jgi:MFS family permease